MTSEAPFPPLVLAVAPNGARKTKADHPELPMSATEIARTAAACRERGAAMIHLHVRDQEGRHSLDVELYRDALRELRRAVGDSMIAQVTSEAVGVYGPEKQMAMVRALRPEAVSLALRELVPDRDGEAAAGAFFAWARDAGIMIQVILYAPEELARLDQLVERGVLAGARQNVLFVLGRYSKGQTSAPADLLPFLAANARAHPWSLCAFGKLETACAVTAAALGGHARIGFENNLYLADGRMAASNAELVGAAAAAITSIGRPLAGAAEARALMAAT